MVSQPKTLPSSAGNDESKLWLARMQEALNSSNFQISYIHMQLDQIRAFRYQHGLIDGEQVAFLEHLNGPLKSSARVGNKVIYLEQDTKPYSVTSDRIPGIMPGAFAGGLLELDGHYRFVLGGRNRIAGHSAQLIRIVAADQYRYQYRVWMDAETAIPLRIDLLDTDNNLLEQLLVIEHHRFNDASPLLHELRAQQWPAVVTAPESPQTHPWRFGWLPSGFEVRHYDQHLLIGLNEPVEYLAVSDGLNDFSVYIGRVGQVQLPTNISSGNGLSLASARHGEFEVVAVGRMPVESLQNVAENLYPATQ